MIIFQNPSMKNPPLRIIDIGAFCEIQSFHWFYFEFGGDEAAKVYEIPAASIYLWLLAPIDCINTTLWPIVGVSRNERSGWPSSMNWNICDVKRFVVLFSAQVQDSLLVRQQGVWPHLLQTRPNAILEIS